MQRRLTFTHHRAYPGLVNVPRHWVRCNPQGTQIAFLMRDDNGIVQLWLISPQGGEPHQLTHNKRIFSLHLTGIRQENGWALCWIIELLVPMRKAARLSI